MYLNRITKGRIVYIYIGSIFQKIIVGLLISIVMQQV
nr:MAG TPA: hypothetical protein [Crassvirales sp.]